MGARELYCELHKVRMYRRVASVVGSRVSWNAWAVWELCGLWRHCCGSDVLWRGGVSLLRAHVSESPQRYSAFGPYLENGGPPPRVAFVASVAAAVG